jgi:hypothetical protein
VRPRDVADKVVKWLYNLRQAGDFAAGLDPIYFGLP